MISKPSFKIQPLKDIPDHELNDGPFYMEDMIGGISPPSPLVVGTIMVYFGLPHACSIIQLGSKTSFSLQRHMQVLCGAHPRFIGTTGHGHVNMIQGPKMLEAQGMSFVLYKTPSRAKSHWFLQMSMPNFCGFKSVRATPYTPR